MVKTMVSGSDFPNKTNPLIKHGYWKWPFIVDLPINSMVIFHSYVSLPEGIFKHTEHQHGMIPSS